MLRISKKVEYALIGLLHMSQRSDQTLTTAKELASNYHIPQELMGKVLQQLARRDLIRSVQGVKGGYKIQRSADQITLNLICEVIDGPFKIVNCIQKKDHLDCEQHHFCTIRNPMEIIQNKLEVFFEQLTLKDLEKEIFQNYSRIKSVDFLEQRKTEEG
jgi:Rrf2 family protein